MLSGIRTAPLKRRSWIQTILQRVSLNTLASTTAYISSSKRTRMHPCSTSIFMARRIGKPIPILIWVWKLSASLLLPKTKTKWSIPSSKSYPKRWLKSSLRIRSMVLKLCVILKESFKEDGLRQKLKNRKKCKFSLWPNNLFKWEFLLCRLNYLALLGTRLCFLPKDTSAKWRKLS